MTHIELRNTLVTAAVTGGSVLAADALAQPSQGGAYGPGMMGGYGSGWMGGYGGSWLPLLLIIIVAGVVGWLIGRKKN
ncbi:MAG: hypothetical protein ABI423_00195 [Burkholderiales bacterium]